MTRTAEAGWIDVPGEPLVAAPLRAVDSWRAEQQGDQLAITMRVAVRGEDPNLRGHFPGLAVFPGVFVIEALGQAMTHATAPGAAAPVLRTVRSVRFLAPLLDGDELTLWIKAVRTADGGWDVTATGRSTDGTTTAKIRAEFDLGEASHA